MAARVGPKNDPACGLASGPDIRPTQTGDGRPDSQRQNGPISIAGTFVELLESRRLPSKRRALQPDSTGESQTTAATRSILSGGARKETSQHQPWNPGAAIS